MPQTAQRHQCAPAQPSTTIRFCPNVAAALGVNEAIIIHRLDYWLGRTKHHFDGRAWVYNTYEGWQAQFPFWSRRTIQTTFRRLERLGIVESSQAYNKSPWHKRKWYRLNHDKLSELVPQTPATEAPAVDAPVVDAPAVDVPVTAPSMAPQATIDETQIGTIDDTETSPSWITKNSSNKSSNKILKRACVREPDAGARTHALETTEPVVTPHPEAKPVNELNVAYEAIPEAERQTWLETTDPEVAPGHPEAKPVNELDAAYEAIPEAERQTWYERADQALEAAGMPEWMRITPTVKEMALRLWVGATIPGVATG
jgi:hypothetical protein